MTREQKDALTATIMQAIERKRTNDMQAAMILGRAPRASEITIDVAPDGSKTYTVEWDKATAQEAGKP